MASFTVRVGLLLVVLGLVGYLMTGGVSLTALIPSAFGAALALCGRLSLGRIEARPWPLRVAVVIAGLGLVATAGAIGQFGAGLSGGGTLSPAIVARASMALLLLVYIAFAVRAFLQQAVRAGR